MLPDIAHEENRLVFCEEGAIATVTNWHRELKASFRDVPELAELVVLKSNLAPLGDHFLDVHRLLPDPKSYRRPTEE
jgi:hypothetical protein